MVPNKPLPKAPLRPYFGPHTPDITPRQIAELFLPQSMLDVGLMAIPGGIVGKGGKKAVVKLFDEVPEYITKNKFVSKSLNLDDDTAAQFAALGDMQRGRPENAMLKVHDADKTGVTGYLAEHIGDIMHRMNEKVSLWDPVGGRQRVLEKLDKTINTLENKVDFETVTSKRTPEVQEALQRYADEHRKLPFHTESQRLARQAAVAYGEGDTATSLRALKELKKRAEDQETYNKSFHELAWRPND